MRERKPPRAVTEASDTVSKSVPSSGPHRPMLAEARAVVDIPVVFCLFPARARPIRPEPQEARDDFRHLW
jgi:hypothetical protein